MAYLYPQDCLGQWVHVSELPENAVIWRPEKKDDWVWMRQVFWDGPRIRRAKAGEVHLPRWVWAKHDDKQWEEYLTPVYLTPEVYEAGWAGVPGSAPWRAIYGEQVPTAPPGKSLSEQGLTPRTTIYAIVGLVILLGPLVFIFANFGGIFDSPYQPQHSFWSNFGFGLFMFGGALLYGISYAWYWFVPALARRRHPENTPEANDQRRRIENAAALAYGAQMAVRHVQLNQQQKDQR